MNKKMLLIGTILLASCSSVDATYSFNTFVASPHKADVSSLSIKNGYFIKDGSTYYSNDSNSLAIATSDQFESGTLEVGVKSNNPSDNGIIFCLDDHDKAAYWENGVSYYFFFVSQTGNAYLGKVDNGSWSALDSIPIDDYSINDIQLIRVTLSGTTVHCYVNDKLYIIFSEYNFLQGKKYGIRAGVTGVTFTSFTKTNDLIYE